MPKALKQKIKLDLSQARRAAAEHKAILEGLSEAGEEAAEGMGEMGEELSEAAVEGEAAAEAVDEVGDAAERSSRKTGLLGGKLKELTLRISDMMDWGLGFATMLGGTFVTTLASAAAYIGGTSAAAVSFESAMIDVRKTTGLTGQSLDQLGDEFLRIASRVGVGRRAVAEIGATAGQLGIEGTENIARFTETVAKMTKVTQMSADEASSSLARIANAFDLPIENAENLASVLNVLSNNSTALAGDLVETLTRGVAAAGKEIGVTVDEAAALGATLIDAGVSARRSGVALRNVFNRISENAATAAEQMGITEEQFREMISEDAVEALKEYMRTLQEMPDQMRSVRAAEVFGERAGNAVATLSGQLDKLLELLPQASSQLEKATSFSREYALSLKAVSRQAGLVWSKIKEWATGQGQKFLPVMMKSLKAINRWMRGVEEAGRELEKFRQREEELKGQLKDLETYRRLKAEQRDLADGAELSAEKQRTLKRATDSLAEAYPGLVKQMKDASEQTVVMAKAIRKAVEAERQLLNLAERDVAQEQANNFQEASTQAERYRAQLKNVRASLERLQQKRADGITVEDVPKHLRTGPTARLYDEQTEAEEYLLGKIEERLQRVNELKVALGEQEAKALKAKKRLAEYFSASGMTEIEEIAATIQNENWLGIDQLKNARGLAREIRDYMQEARNTTIDYTSGDELTDATGPGGLPLTESMLADQNQTDGSDEITEEEKRSIENAREALRSYIRAQKIANAQTDEWKQALRDVYEAQDDIAKLEDIKDTLGSGVVDRRIDVAKERLRLARERVKEAKDFTAQIRNGNEALEAATSAVSAEDLGVSAIETFMDRFEQYRKRVSELRAKLEAGKIEAGEFEDRISKASEDALEALRPILRALVEMGVLTEEQMDNLVQNIRNVESEAEDASEGGLEDMAEKVQAIAQAVDGVKQLANTFGDLGDEAEAALDSVANLASSVGRLVASKGADPGAWVGAVTSAASLIGQALGANDKAERRAEEMVEKMEENVQALRENTEALLESARVGGGLTGNEVERMSSIAKRLGRLTAGLSSGSVATSFADFSKAKNLLEELERMGLDGAGKVRKILEKLGDPEVRKELGFGTGRQGLQNAMKALFTGEGAEALRKRFGDFPALVDVIEEVKKDFGMFGDSVAGAVEKMQFLQENGLANAQKAFQAFAEKLLSLDMTEKVEGKDLGGAGIKGGPSLRALLKEAKGLDLSTAEGRERLREIKKMIAEAIAEGEFNFGGLTRKEMDKILDTFGTDFSSDGAGSDRYTQSVQQQAKLTEFQGNRLLMYQSEQVYLLGELLAALTGEEVAVSTAALGTVPSDPLKAIEGHVRAIRGQVTGAAGPLGTIKDEVQAIRKEVAGSVASTNMAPSPRTPPRSTTVNGGITVEVTNPGASADEIAAKVEDVLRRTPTA